VNAPSAQIVDRLSACLRGEPETFVDVTARAVLDAAAWHGVTSLLAQRLDTRADVDRELQATLQRERALGGALEMLRQREIVRVLNALATGGIQPVLVKGSALAYSLYRDPSLRPRLDSDVLVRKEEASSVAAVMTALGYGRPPQVTGDLVMHQVDYVRKDASGIRHVFDFHWKISNRQAVADALTFEDIEAESRPIPELGPVGRGPSRVHALVFACVHRIAHHSADERLIWLYDIHLLAGGLSAVETEAFIRLARDRSVTLICADGLLAARGVLGTRLPAGLLERLTPAGIAVAPEPSALLLTDDPTLARELLSDLRAVSWPERVRLIREHAFPSATYMSAAYTVSNRAWLPALYTHRLVRGAWRLLRGAAR
jgi:hypothetical protein